MVEGLTWISKSKIGESILPVRESGSHSGQRHVILTPLKIPLFLLKDPIQFLQNLLVNLRPFRNLRKFSKVSVAQVNPKDRCCIGFYIVFLIFISTFVSLHNKVKEC